MHRNTREWRRSIGAVAAGLRETQKPDALRLSEVKDFNRLGDTLCGGSLHVALEAFDRRAQQRF